MTSEKEQPDLTLPVKKTEPIHFVDDEGERVLVQCLVLEDGEDTDNFLLKGVGQLPSLLITNVEPAKNDEESVIISFRNLNNLEILERVGAGILPYTTLQELFDDTDDIIREELEETAGGKENLEAADEDNVQNLKIGLLVAHNAELPTVHEQTEYKAKVSLDATHLAQIVNVSTGGPAFAVMAASTFNAYKRRKVVNRPLISDLTTLYFPVYGSGDFNNATEVLNQKITGHYFISPTPGTEYTVRGDVLSLVMGLAHGSKDALIRTFRLLNSTTKAEKAVQKRSEGDYSINPTAKQLELYIMKEIVDYSYQIFSTDNIARLAPSPTTPETFDTTVLDEADNEILAQLFQNSGLDEMFETVLAEEEHPPTPVPFPEEASYENIIEYFSSKITMDSFPSSMNNLKETLHFPVLFEHDWADEEPDDEEGRISAGAALVSKIFTLAVRYARLQQLALVTELPINPSAVLIQTLSGSEPSLWALEETIRRLPEGEDGLSMFSEILTSGLVHPRIAPGPLPVNFILKSLVPPILHRTGHIILQEEWKHEEIMNMLSPYSLLVPFVDGLYEGSRELDDTLQDGMCIALESALQTLISLDFQEKGKELIEELGRLLIELANIKAMEKLVDVDEDSADYKLFLQNYLVSQLIYNGRI